jgi:hypothetical protein
MLCIVRLSGSAVGANLPIRPRASPEMTRPSSQASAVIDGPGRSRVAS